MRFAPRFLLRACLLVSVGSATWSCAESGPYVWARDVPAQAQPPGGATYLIRNGDQLDIRVYNEDRLAGRPRVRSDGKITMALIGEVQAEGKSPAALAQELTVLLSKYLNTPTVTVGVDDSRPMTITLLGELGRPGVYSLNADSSLLQALATAGGFTEFADRDSVFVVRARPPQRVRFRYRDLVSNEPASVAFRLLDGDVITVE